MREEKYYVCETCGCKYDKEDQAIECEDRHQPFLDVMEYQYKALNLHPDRIKLKFHDDVSVWYRREE